MNDTTDRRDEVSTRKASSFRDRRSFVEFPRQLYRGDPSFVPPISAMVLAQLDERKNPFFEHARQALFLAHRSGSVVGRVAAVVDEDLQRRHNRPVGVFGFLEFVDDRAVLEALLRSACDWLREQGVEEVLGPIQHSTNYECGLLVEGFETPPFVMMTHNPPYYADRLLELGLAPAMDLLAYRITRATLDRERIRRISDRVLKRSGIELRSLNIRRFESELAIVRKIYNEAWDDNWGFVPLREKEFRAQAMEMKRIMRPEFCVIAEKGGEVAGFGLALPDFNQVLRAIKGRLFPFGLFRLPGLLRKVKQLRVITMGILPEHRAGGLEAPLILEIADRAYERGYEVAELSWVLENNLAMRKAIEGMGGTISKRYRLYGAPLPELMRTLEKSAS